MKLANYQQINEVNKVNDMYENEVNEMYEKEDYRGIIRYNKKVLKKIKSFDIESVLKRNNRFKHRKKKKKLQVS